MPKVVDHEARRSEIAQALWRVLHRDGIRAVSVRTVAAEAGWSAGSLRHYFPDQSGLLSAAMELVTRRVTARLEALPSTGPVGELVIRYLEEVIPLDAERRTEFEVWWALTSEARINPALTPHLVAANDALRSLCTQLVDALAAAGQLGKGRNTSRETERLHALIDGVSLHAATPQRLTPRQVRTILRTHLSDLTHPA